MKRFFATLFAAAVFGQAVYGTEWETRWVEFDAEKAISGATPDEGYLVFPDSVDGYPVTAVADYAFSYSALGGFMLPSSIKTIGRNAFQYCTSLSSVFFAEGLESIGNRAFQGDSELTAVEFPASLVSIGEGAFHRCGLTSLALPATLESIGDNAFGDCSALSTLTVPANISIGENAFSGVSPTTLEAAGAVGGLSTGKVETFIAADGTTELAGQSFKGDAALRSVKLPASLKTLRSAAFEGCTALDAIDFAEGLETIQSRAFHSCSALTALDLPETLTSIGAEAFAACRGLTEVRLPDATADLGFSAFSNCSNLVSIRLPPGLTAIPFSLFNSCGNLEEVNIPSHVTVIGERAFAWCRTLKTLELPDSLQTIESDAFRDCESLSSLVIPKNVAALGQRAFQGCKGLRFLYLPRALEASFSKADCCSGCHASLDIRFYDGDTPPPLGPFPSLDGETDPLVGYDDATRTFTIRSSTDCYKVAVSIPEGLDPSRVIVEAKVGTLYFTPGKAKFRVLSSDGVDITPLLDIPAPDDEGCIPLFRSEVREEFAKEALAKAQGASFDLNPLQPSITTAPTRPGLYYYIIEGADHYWRWAGEGHSGDGERWTPTLTRWGEKSGFFSIGVTPN